MLFRPGAGGNRSSLPKSSLLQTLVIYLPLICLYESQLMPDAALAFRPAPIHHVDLFSTPHVGAFVT
jgi:hypothetical protein